MGFRMQVENVTKTKQKSATQLVVNIPETDEVAMLLKMKEVPSDQYMRYVGLRMKMLTGDGSDHEWPWNAH